jgi:stage III sporulation protein AH
MEGKFMNFDDVKTKIKGFNWRNFFTSRNFIIVCCVLFLGAAIVVYSVATKDNGVVDASKGTKNLGNTVLVDNEVSNADAEAQADAEGDSFFAVSVINREKTRDEAMAVLQSIADSADAMPDAKEEAMLSISAMVDDMKAEANIEMLVKSKGFEECVAVISGEKCSVIVKTEGLLADEVARILEIATEQSGLPATGINIIEKNG